MCYAKPGPRCSGHAKKTLDKAVKRGDRSVILVARDSYDETKMGQEELLSKILSSNSDGKRMQYQVRLASAKDRRKIKIQQYKIEKTKSKPELITPEEKYTITTQDITEYTRGGCWNLAEVIAEKTGGTVYGIAIEGESRSNGYQHFLVETSSGVFTDINGHASEEEVLMTWAEGASESGDEEVFEDSYDNYDGYDDYRDYVLRPLSVDEIESEKRTKLIFENAFSESLNSPPFSNVEKVANSLLSTRE